ncbi:MAG TPA: JAB domain-containing protein [Cyclobacteriaceae bacterium]|jgi:DNA repair protein RadC|nr:JAB domain-containing protein [Cyclobacteriaceae bacterium]
MEINNEQQWQAAEIELSYKSKVKPSLRPKITTSKDAYDILRVSWNHSTIELFEEFKVLMTNRANKVLAVYALSKGGMAGTVADPKLIFVAALKLGASGIILAHNHPSGNLRPSQQDIDLTKRVKEAGRFLEIPLLDHVILTSEGYFSFADEGLI